MCVQCGEYTRIVTCYFRRDHADIVRVYPPSPHLLQARVCWRTKPCDWQLLIVVPCQQRGGNLGGCSDAGGITIVSCAHSKYLPTDESTGNIAGCKWPLPVRPKVVLVGRLRGVETLLIIKVFRPSFFFVLSHSRPTDSRYDEAAFYRLNSLRRAIQRRQVTHNKALIG